MSRTFIPCVLLALTLVGCAYVLDVHCQVCDDKGVASPLMPGMLLAAALYRATGRVAMDQNGDLMTAAASLQ
jgi:hypothetical protein